MQLEKLQGESEGDGMNNSDQPRKPLGQKAYGSIGHLPGSRRGTGDHGVPDGQGVICCEKARDKHDVIIVQEKLDGSCCSVANIDGAIVALGRSGYLAASSPYRQHHMFDAWVHERWDKFAFLMPGERVVGEWMAQAHGTRYKLLHAPFVVFDIMRGHERALLDELMERVGDSLPKPHVISRGPPCSIRQAVATLGEYGFHGALDGVEGAVWRVERKGKVDFLAKYVKPSKVDGCYLPEKHCGHTEIWNWIPEGQSP